jgi:hypothetical protein
MKKIRSNDFDKMTIIEIIEFLKEKREMIEKYDHELENYFMQKKPESVVPFYYYDVYVDVKTRSKYDMIRDYLDNIRLEDKPKAIGMSDDFYELNWINKREIERTRSLRDIKRALYSIYKYEGNRLFLEELFEKGYFNSGKAQVILKRYLKLIHASIFSKNGDIMSALAIFMKGKDESIQMFITELIIDYVLRSEERKDILLYIYKDGMNYTKRGVMNVFVKDGWRMFSTTDDFHGAKKVLDVVAEDLKGDDLFLRNQIIGFIEMFELVQDEIIQYLLEEKGIIYTQDMKYEAFYDKVVDMAEVLKEKMDEEKEKDKNDNH